MNLPSSQPIDERALRGAFGEFATGITIVAGRHPETDEPIGFACQSFSSLSLDPPLLLFTAMETSRSWPLIAASGRFSVNILAADQQPISELFGRPNPNRFDKISWQPSAANMPLIDGAVAWMDCQLAQELPGGDHTIVVGQIEDLGTREDAMPLIYHRAGYSELSRPGQRSQAHLRDRRPSV